MQYVVVKNQNLLNIKRQKHQDAKGLLSKLGIKTQLSKVPIFDEFCFKWA